MSQPPREPTAAVRSSLTAPRVPAVTPEEPLTLELTSVARTLDSQTLEIEPDAVTELDDGGTPKSGTSTTRVAPPVGVSPHRSATPPPPQRGVGLGLKQGRKAGSPALEGRRAAPGAEEGHTLAHELDAAFGAMTTSSGQPSIPPIDAPSAVHELFDQLAANHLRDVRDFVIALRWKEPVPGWIAICQPAVTSLLGAARQMEKTDLCSRLEAFEKTLKDAAQDDGTLSDSARASVIEAYGRVAQGLPEAFSVDAEATRREAVIVHSLLQQVRDVTPMTIEKLFAAGVTKVEVFFSAKPEEIAQTTGIRGATAAAIVQKFRSYRKTIEEQASDGMQAAERRRLAALTERLKTLEQEYEQACEGWSDDAVAKKRQLRQERADLLLDLKIVLARLGELESISRVERAPFREKISYLEAYLRRSSKPQDPLP